MTPQVKVGDRVKYISTAGREVIIQVVKVEVLHFTARTISINGLPPVVAPKDQTHNYSDWALNGFQLLRRKVRFIDHDAYYTTEPIE